MQRLFKRKTSTRQEIINLRNDYKAGIESLIKAITSISEDKIQEHVDNHHTPLMNEFSEFKKDFYDHIKKQ